VRRRTVVVVVVNVAEARVGYITEAEDIGLLAHDTI